MRIFGIVLLCVSGGGVALTLVRDEGARLSQVRALLALVRRIRDMISAYAMPCDEILRGCPHEITEGVGYPADAPAPSDLASMVALCEVIDGESREIFARLAEEFTDGGLDRGGLCERCEAAAEALSRRESELSREAPLRKKTVAAISLAVAAALVILLL